MAHPDATLAMHCQRWQETLGVRVSNLAMWRRLYALGLTLKKAPERVRARCDRPGDLAETMATDDSQTLLVLDETSTPTTLTPTRAQARRGVRAIGRVPRGRWRSVNLLTILPPTGLGAGLQLEGAIDRSSFETFVTHVHVPTLKPGQTVVTDNLSVHQSSTVGAAIAAAGCRMVLLPTHSPDFNPIAQGFAKLKGLPRQAEARTVDAIMTATQAAYLQITPQDTCGFSRDTGYNV